MGASFVMRSLSVLLFIILLLNSQSSSVSAQDVNGVLDFCTADLSFLPVPFNNLTGLTCRPVWNTFVLRFSQTKDNVVNIILTAVYTSGWVGMGFSKDGMMVGSSAMAGWITREGHAHIKQYYIRGFTSSEVIPDKGELPLTNVPPAVVLNGPTIYLAFQLKVQNRLQHQPIILAFGTKHPVHHQLSSHDDKTTVVFDFSEGSHSGGSRSSQGQGLMLLRRNHGILAITGWGVLLPAGAIVARYFRHRDPLWYYLHASIQFLGFLIGLATVVAGKVLYRRIQANIPAHANIGIVVLVLSILQIMAFFIRPDKDSKIRKYWNWYHHWFGRLALLLAAVNILLGIQAAGADPAWRTIYGFILAVIFITVIALEVLLQMRRRAKPPQFQTDSI